ncbi:MAG: hypothetical protein QOJ19_678 [Acidimicrobiia bacterium]|nr:hypothetical protein [Acidimicrobiia bacterium]
MLFEPTHDSNITSRGEHAISVVSAGHGYVLLRQQVGLSGDADPLAIAKG